MDAVCEVFGHNSGIMWSVVATTRAANTMVGGRYLTKGGGRRELQVF